jgi:hypothetical protein
LNAAQSSSPKLPKPVMRRSHESLHGFAVGKLDLDGEADAASPRRRGVGHAPGELDVVRSRRPAFEQLDDVRRRRVAERFGSARHAATGAVLYENENERGCNPRHRRALSRGRCAGKVSRARCYSGVMARAVRLLRRHESARGARSRAARTSAPHAQAGAVYDSVVVVVDVEGAGGDIGGGHSGGISCPTATRRICSASDVWTSPLPL